MTDLQPLPEPGANARAEHRRLRTARLRRDPASEPTAYEEAWRKGAEGERQLGEALNAAANADTRLTVLHDLTIDGRRANIDHVVIGPAGVTIVDAKAWSGRVSVGNGTLWQGRRPRGREVDGMREQVHRICAALALRGRDDVPVRSALCFVNENTGIADRPMQMLAGVALGGVRAVIAYAAADGPLSPADVGEIHRLVASAFIVHGGVTVPRAAVSGPPPAGAQTHRSRCRMCLRASGGPGHHGACCRLPPGAG